jgi:hypothetical protein
MGWKRTRALAAVALILIAPGCGGDDDAADDSSGGGDQSAAPSGGNGGELVLGDEAVTLDRARCFLEEQDSAGGGGKILFVRQGFGTNAAGEEVLVDVSRYDEDSRFTGDDILVDIGEPGSSVSFQANADLGTISVDGSTLSADGPTFVGKTVSPYSRSSAG